MLSSVTKTLLVGAVAVAGQGWLGPVGKTGRSSGRWAFFSKGGTCTPKKYIRNGYKWTVDMSNFFYHHYSIELESIVLACRQ